MKKRQRKPVPKGMLTYKDAAAYLGCGLRSLQRYVADGRISDTAKYVVAGRILFRIVELDKILEGGGIK